MRKANPRKTFLTGFSLLRFQLILLLVTVCVRVIFWIFHAPASLAVMLIVTFFTGNLALGVFLPTRRWFTHRPPPWNWIIYLPLLVGTGILASVVAEIPLFLLTSRNISFGRAFLLDAPLGITITVIVGVVYYAFGDTRLRLEARNQQLQSQVQLGLMERQTHQTDLQQAHEIQMHLLPRETPQLPGFQIACAWQPARSVSGDYFDVLVLAKNKLGLCIADVSGKGMAAALLMANLQASVKAFTADSDHSLTVSPAELCAKLNNALCDHIAPGRFITFFYGILDGATRKLRYENAGHCLPVLVHANGAIEFPAAYSGVLGLFSHWTYSDREVQLVSGDVLLLMTDGVFEAWDAKEEEFGYQRLIASVMASRHQGVHAIRKRVLEDVTAFCSNQFQDDASLIVITVD